MKKTLLSRPHIRSFERGNRRRQTGITLLEILVAIFIVGVGLLALLTLFPVGALEMAQAIKDDRTAAVAEKAAALSEAGEKALSELTQFVVDSLSTGSMDPKVANHLLDEFDDLAVQAADVELDLRNLQTVFPRQWIQPHVGPLLGQVGQIQVRITIIGKLLRFATA